MKIFASRPSLKSLKCFLWKLIDETANGEFCGEGFGELKNRLADFFKVYDKSDYSFLVRDRHISLFNSSLGYLKKALSKIEKDSYQYV